MEKAYRFRIYPTTEQIVQIQKTFGCTRYVFNHFLGKRIEIYKTDGTTLNFAACCSELTELKKELGWLYEPDSTALQSSLRDLDFAYQNFFRRAKKGWKPGFPKFKRKRDSRKSYKSKRVGENIAILDNCVKLPKLGLVKAAISKQAQGRILNATVSQNPSGKYFVSVCCTDVDIEPYPSTGVTVGLDMGLTDLVITSDDTIYPNHKHIRKSEKKLARAQRQLSRKQKGSNNWNKARIRVAKIHERVCNQRRDAIHKMTTQIIKGNDIICIEDLNVSGMMRNRKLAKSISDAAWGEVKRQLEYKSDWHGRVLVQIDRFFPSSQLCSCGYRNTDTKDLSVRIWICPECKKVNDRDINAANNILKEGLRLLVV